MFTTPTPTSGVVLALVLTGCGPDPGTTASDASRPHLPDSGTYVMLLGTGTPNQEPDRSGAATAVVVNGHAYLVDAGPGVVRRTVAGSRQLAALRTPDLDIAFITHLHSDHTVGLADLIFSPWVLGRDRPLRLFGPPGTADMVRHLHRAYEADIRNRLDGLEPANERGYLVDATDITAGVVYEDSNVTVRAIPVKHGSWTHAFGYRFDTADRRIVISGDAAPTETIVEACNGCDVLVHEVYSAVAFARRAPEWQRYHASAHTSTVELADLATRARPGLLVLYHTLGWGESPEGLIREIREAGYEGEIRYGEDLAVY